MKTPEAHIVLDISIEMETPSRGSAGDMVNGWLHDSTSPSNSTNIPQQGPIVLIGDACHPTLPYQAQGAAMAVEDGAVLGALLGRLQEHLTESTLDKRVKIADILKLFEQRRKQRTEINVSGAVEKQDFYHLPDGERQIERDQLLADLPKADFKVHCKWSWGDKSYNDELLGVDVIRDAESSFTDWVKKQKL